MIKKMLEIVSSCSLAGRKSKRNTRNEYFGLKNDYIAQYRMWWIYGLKIPSKFVRT